MRLNRYIAHAGLTSRRKADDLILQGAIQVNGRTLKEVGYQVQPNDQVLYKGKHLTPQKKVYLLLHKPFNTITTLEDPQKRKTVLACLPPLQERIYPIGRLDRNTTGALLFTNDGALAKALAHPSSEVTKTYQVTLKSALPKAARFALRKGIVLTDGKASLDALTPLDATHCRYEIKLHSGKNRIIRRLFAHLQMPLLALERTQFADLTLEGLTAGSYRHLSPQEVVNLYQLTGLSAKSMH